MENSTFKKFALGIISAVVAGLILTGVLYLLEPGTVEFIDLGSGLELRNKTRGNPIVDIRIYYNERGKRSEERIFQKLHGALAIHNNHGPGAEYVVLVTGDGEVYVSERGVFAR